MRNNRSRKIALVAHCILNQNARASGLADESSVIAEVVDLLARNKMGIIQMPCPELAYSGLLRQPKTREQYDNISFRRCCRSIAEGIANQVHRYEKCGIRLKLVVGIEGSPSCGVSEPSGILVEELRKVLGEKGISAPFCEIDCRHLKDGIAKLERLIKQE